MSAIAAAYVRRHVLWQVNRTKGVILMAMAEVADDQGVTRSYLQADMEHDLKCSPSTITRAMSAMLRPPPGAPGPFLIKRTGRKYVIAGVAEHDPWTCDSDECRGEAQARQEQGGGRLSERKRQQTAARVRAYRARQRAARETG